MNQVGELEIIDTSLYYPKILRKNCTVALINAASGPTPTRSSMRNTAAVRA